MVKKIKDSDTDAGFLYVVYNEWFRDPITNEMPYKIGITKRTVEERRNEFGVKLPGEIITLFSYKIKNYKKIERKIHDMLNILCVNGEWYRVNARALKAIQEYCIDMGGILNTEEIENEIENEIDVLTKSKNQSQYLFNGAKYRKGRLVLAVVSDYIYKNKNITLEKLQNVFNIRFEGVLPLVETYTNAENSFLAAGRKRYYLDEAITLSDGLRVVVCSEWRIENIGIFLNKAKELGYTIKTVK